MKKTYRIISLALALIFLLQFSSLATNLEDVEKKLEEKINNEINYMDDVYKYDLSLTDDANDLPAEVVDEKEVFKYYKADKIAVALDLIKLGQGNKFDEEKILTVNEFLNITSKLGADVSKFEGIEAVTQGTAMRMLLDVIGFDSEDNKKIIRFISDIHLFKGIKYNPEKFMTRGEMAQLIYNTLSQNRIQVLAVGEKLVYEQIEGDTLLKHIFNLTEIEGLLNAADGMNIFANKNLRSNEIEINRYSYMLEEGASAGNLLGSNVFALVDATDTSYKKVAFLDKDPEDESAVISFSDIESIANKRIQYYDEGEKKNISIGGVTKYLFNGNSQSGNINSTLLTGEGVIVVNNSNKLNTGVAVIKKYDTFVIDRASSLDEKIYLKDGLLYKGSNSINVEKSSTIVKSYYKNGKPAVVSDLKAGDVINVFSVDGRFIQIEASTDTVSGKITAKTSTTVFIDDKEYYVSDLYDLAKQKGAKLPDLTIGLESDFALTHLGSIAYFADYSSGFSYGVMKKYGKGGSSLNKKAYVRIFNTDSEWADYPLTDNATVDGKKMNADQAIAHLDAAEANFVITNATKLNDKGELKDGMHFDSLYYSMVRYKANSDGEIKFLDTIATNVEENTDIDALVESEYWDGSNGQFTIDWTKGDNLRGTSYSISKNALIFFVPDDKDDEEEYKLYKQSDLLSGNTAKFIFYNADDYFVSDVILYSGDARGGSFINTDQFIINSVLKGVDKNGSDIFILKGLQSSLTEGNKGFNPTTYRTTASICKNWPDLASGDLLHLNLDSNGNVYQLDRMMRASLKDSGPTLAEYPGKAINAKIGEDELIYGTVISCDPVRGMVRVMTSNGNDWSFNARITAIYDSAKKEAVNASLDDVTAGDKIYLRGGYRRVSAIVYR